MPAFVGFEAFEKDEAIQKPKNESYRMDGALSRVLKMCGKRDPTTRIRGLQELARIEKNEQVGAWWEANIERICSDPEWRVRSAAVEALDKTEPRFLRGREKVAAELWLLSYDPELRATHLWTKVYPKSVAIEKHAENITRNAISRLEIKERRVATLAACEALCLVSSSEIVQRAIALVLAKPITWLAFNEKKRQKELSIERRMCQRLIRAAGSEAIRQARQLEPSMLNQTLVSKLLAETDPDNASTMWDAVLILDCAQPKMMAAAVKRGPKFASTAIDRDLPSITESWSILHDAFLDAVITIPSSGKARTLLERLFQVPLVNDTREKQILAQLWLAYVVRLEKIPSESLPVSATEIVALALKQDMLITVAKSECSAIHTAIAESDEISLDQRVTALSATKTYQVKSLETLIKWFLSCDTLDLKRQVIRLTKRSLHETDLIQFLDTVIPDIENASLPIFSELIGSVDAAKSTAWKALEARCIATDPLPVAASGLASEKIMARACEDDPWRATEVLRPLFDTCPAVEALCFRYAALNAGLSSTTRDMKIFSSAVASERRLIYPSEDLLNIFASDVDAWVRATTWTLKSANNLNRALEPHPWTCATSSQQKLKLLNAVLNEKESSLLEMLMLDGLDDSSRLVEAARLQSGLPESWLCPPRTEKRVKAAQDALKLDLAHRPWIRALFSDTPVYPPVEHCVPDFKPGDLALYDGEQCCQVLSVETYDDEHYYRIRFLDDEREKDTVVERLSRMQENVVLQEERIEHVPYCDDDKDGGERRRFEFAREMWFIEAPNVISIREFALRGLNLSERIECCTSTTDLGQLAAWYDTVAVIQPLPLAIRAQAIALLNENVNDTRNCLEWLSAASLRGAFEPLTLDRASIIVDAAAKCIEKYGVRGTESLASVVAIAARTDSGAVRRFVNAVTSTLAHKDMVPSGLAIVASLIPLNLHLVVPAEICSHIAEILFNEEIILSFDAFFAGVTLLLGGPKSLVHSHSSIQKELMSLAQIGYPPRGRGVSRLRVLAALLLAIESGIAHDTSIDIGQRQLMIGNGLVACLDSWRDGGDATVRLPQKGNSRKRGVHVSQYDNLNVSKFLAENKATKDSAEALLAILVAYQCFVKAPSFSREWAAAASAKDASAVRKLAEEVLLGAAVDRELEAVSQQASSRLDNSQNDDSSLAINVSKVSKQVTAVYKRDECVIEMILTYSTAHPLRSVIVDFGMHQGIQDATARRWALQLRACANHQNTIEAIHRWRSSLDLEFNHVEPCPICYGVLHPKSKRLPHIQCSTCSNKFHGSCLAHWFQTSHKHLCPVCQSDFVAAKASSKSSSDKASSLSGPDAPEIEEEENELD